MYKRVINECMAVCAPEAAANRKIQGLVKKTTIINIDVQNLPNSKDSRTLKFLEAIGEAELLQRNGKQNGTYYAPNAVKE
jgi:hypothetical protein